MLGGSEVVVEIFGISGEMKLYSPLKIIVLNCGIARGFEIVSGFKTVRGY
jgi:hypothetical protein